VGFASGGDSIGLTDLNEIRCFTRSLPLAFIPSIGFLAEASGSEDKPGKPVGIPAPMFRRWLVRELSRRITAGARGFIAVQLI
jgi:hypothetical protein